MRARWVTVALAISSFTTSLKVAPEIAGATGTILMLPAAVCMGQTSRPNIPPRIRLSINLLR